MTDQTAPSIADRLVARIQTISGQYEVALVQRDAQIDELRAALKSAATELGEARAEIAGLEAALEDATHHDPGD